MIRYADLGARSGVSLYGHDLDRTAAATRNLVRSAAPSLISRGRGEAVSDGVATTLVRDEFAAGSNDVVIVSSLASDSHTWNLVFLQMLIEELGNVVVNLGPCVPDELLIAECRDRSPALVVISSVNGHGYHEGMRVIKQFRKYGQLAGSPVVIGGKLGVSGARNAQHIDSLVTAGFDAVFEGDANGVVSFRNFLRQLPEREGP